MNIFVSYSRLDFPFVRDLDHELRASGFRTWVDVRETTPAQKWLPKTLEAIEECSCFIIVMSPYAVRSTTVGKELDAAAELDKVIIPVLLQDAEPPERLKQIQWMDFRVSFRQGLRQLLELLKDNTSFVEDQDIHVPPRSYKWKGWTPLMSVVSPVSVRLLTLWSFISLGFKFLLTFFLWVTALSTALGQHQPNWVGLCLNSLLLAGCGSFQCFCAYRATWRKATFGEMLALQITVIVFFLFFPWFFAVTYPQGRTLQSMTYVPFALEAPILIGMSSLRSYRRWMVAYTRW